MSLLKSVKPMGIYETLYAFQEATGVAVGDKGTHPWSQGFPLTSKLENGPEFPNLSSRTAEQRMYPKAWGEPELRERIAEYYRTTYGTKLTDKNVMVFGGGRPAIFSLLMFLEKEVEVKIASTEYTPYWDILKFLNKSPQLIPSNESNQFSPDPKSLFAPSEKKGLTIMSNPCNPTGVARTEDELAEIVGVSKGKQGFLCDEAYEWFTSGDSQSALKFVEDINDSNVFVAGATTKNYQDPGLRLGWLVGPEEDINSLGNYSSFAMGGVSRPSQLEAIALLEPKRRSVAQKAVKDYYTQQRDRYGEALSKMGLKLFTGHGGFYHWCKLPDGMKAMDLNKRLFKEKAAILPGVLCDMARGEKNYQSPLDQFFRFSFGPLHASSFKEDIEILERALA